MNIYEIMLIVFEKTACFILKSNLKQAILVWTEEINSTKRFGNEESVGTVDPQAA